MRKVRPRDKRWSPRSDHWLLTESGLEPWGCWQVESAQSARGPESQGGDDGTWSHGSPTAFGSLSCGATGQLSRDQEAFTLIYEMVHWSTTGMWCRLLLPRGKPQMMITAHGPRSHAHTNTHGLSLITPRPSGTTVTRAPRPRCQVPGVWQEVAQGWILSASRRGVYVMSWIS